MFKMKEIQKEDSYYKIEIQKKTYRIPKQEVYFDFPLLIFKYENAKKCFIAEDTKYYYLHLNGRNYKLPKKKEENIKKELHVDIKELKAPLPGIITKINVKENQKVKQGEILIIIESMKMENQIISPKEGFIAKILVTTNQKVEVNQTLIQFQD